MNVRIDDDDLDRLEIDPRFTNGLSDAVVTSYRRKMQFIRAAKDARDLRSIRALRLEKLKGKRSHLHSIRLNDQMRLILQFEGAGEETEVVVVGIEDYH